MNQQIESLGVVIGSLVVMGLGWWAFRRVYLDAQDVRPHVRHPLAGRNVHMLKPILWGTVLALGLVILGALIICCEPVGPLAR